VFNWLKKFVSLILNKKLFFFLLSPFLFSQWTIETVDVNFANYSKTYILIDNQNIPHIAYLPCYTNYLKYAKKIGATWNIQTVATDAYTTAGGPTLALSMAFDTIGNPWITYTSGSEFNQKLKIAYFNGTSWDTLKISDPDCHKASIAFNNSGNPVIGYQNDTKGKQIIAEWNGISWVYDTVDNVTWSIGKVSLVIENSGMHHYAYDFSISNASIRCADGTPTNWNINDVDSGAWTSMKINNSGTIYIAYTSPFNTDLWIAYFDGVGWNSSLVDTGHGTGSQLIAPSLDIDTFNFLHIVYLQQMASKPNYYRLKYAFYDGSTWYFEKVDSDFVWHVPSLAVEPDGSVHIVYQKGGELKHAYRGSFFGEEDKRPHFDSRKNSYVKFYVKEIILSDNLTIIFKGRLENPLNINIFRSDGKLVFRKSYNISNYSLIINSTELKDFSDGIYFLNIYSKNHRQMFYKLILLRP